MGLISRVSSRTYRKKRDRNFYSLPTMKLNIAFPATGQQKTIEIDDEAKLRPFYEKRIAHEISIDHLGDEYKGYVLRITGGEDKQGFSAKQGVLVHGRVRLLMKKGMSGYRSSRRGERKRKSVRGCIIDHNMSVISTIVVRKGENEIAGLTDSVIDRRLGPKRANKIRKLFNLSKDDDVRRFVIRRDLKPNEKHAQSSAARNRAEAAKEADSAFRRVMAARAKALRAKKDSERSHRQSIASSN